MAGRSVRIVFGIVVLVALIACGSAGETTKQGVVVEPATDVPATNAPLPTATRIPTEPPATEIPSPTVTDTPVVPTNTAVPPTQTLQPTAPPALDTDTPIPPAPATDTPIPPTPMPQPTEPPAAPTATSTAPPPAAARIVIVAVNKRAEYVDLQNQGGVAQDLTGWVLLSEKGQQSCTLGGSIAPGQTLRVWAMSADAGQGGFNCGFGTNIWNNDDPDAAVLFDAQGREVARY